MQKMIEVFKTNIQKESEAKEIQNLLMEHFPESNINFDLEDRDNILRVESNYSVSDNIIEVLKFQGYYCEEIF